MYAKLTFSRVSKKAQKSIGHCWKVLLPLGVYSIKKGLLLLLFVFSLLKQKCFFVKKFNIIQLSWFRKSNAASNIFDNKFLFMDTHIFCRFGVSCSSWLLLSLPNITKVQHGTFHKFLAFRKVTIVAFIRLW